MDPFLWCVHPLDTENGFRVLIDHDWVDSNIFDRGNSIAGTAH